MTVASWRSVAWWMEKGERIWQTQLARAAGIDWGGDAQTVVEAVETLRDRAPEEWKSWVERSAAVWGALRGPEALGWVRQAVGDKAVKEILGVSELDGAKSAWSWVRIPVVDQDQGRLYSGVVGATEARVEKPFPEWAQAFFADEDSQATLHTALEASKRLAREKGANLVFVPLAGPGGQVRDTSLGLELGVAALHALAGRPRAHGVMCTGALLDDGRVGAVDAVTLGAKARAVREAGGKVLLYPDENQGVLADGASPSVQAPVSLEPVGHLKQAEIWARSYREERAAGIRLLLERMGSAWVFIRALGDPEIGVELLRSVWETSGIREVLEEILGNPELLAEFGETTLKLADHREGGQRDKTAFLVERVTAHFPDALKRMERIHPETALEWCTAGALASGDGAWAERARDVLNRHPGLAGTPAAQRWVALGAAASKAPARGRTEAAGAGAARPPNVPEGILHQGNAKARLGRLKEALGDYDAAIEILKALREDLESGDAWTPEMRNALAAAYMNRGNAKRDLGRLEEALGDYDEAIEIGEALREDLESGDAWTPEMRSVLAAAYMNRGNAKARLGRLKEALGDYDAAIEIWEALREDLESGDAWTLEMRNDLAGAYMNRGNAKQDLGRLKEALGDYDAAIEILKALREDLESGDAWTPEMRNALAAAYMNRGNAKRDLGRLEEALGDYDEAIEIREALRKALAGDAWTPQMRNALAGAYVNRGNTKQRLGRFPEALGDYDAAIEILKALREDLESGDAWTLEMRNDLVLAYVNRGHAHLRTGDPGHLKNAEQDAKEALALTEGLGAGVPASCEVRVQVLYLRAQVFWEKDRDLDRVDDALAKALRLLRGLEQGGVSVLRPLRETVFAAYLRVQVARLEALGRPDDLTQAVRNDLDPDVPGSAPDSAAMYDAALDALVAAYGWFLRHGSEDDLEEIEETFGRLKRVADRFLAGTYEGLKARVGLHLARANWEQASRELERYTEKAPSDPEGWALWGDLLFERKHYEEAREMYERAVGLLVGQAGGRGPDPDLGRALAGLVEKITRCVLPDADWLERWTPAAAARVDEALEAIHAIIVAYKTRWKGAAWADEQLGRRLDEVWGHWKKKREEAQDGVRAAEAAGPSASDIVGAYLRKRGTTGRGFREVLGWARRGAWDLWGAAFRHDAPDGAASLAVRWMDLYRSHARNLEPGWVGGEAQRLIEKGWAWLEGVDQGLVRAVAGAVYLAAQGDTWWATMGLGAVVKEVLEALAWPWLRQMAAQEEGAVRAALGEGDRAGRWLTWVRGVRGAEGGKAFRPGLGDLAWWLGRVLQTPPGWTETVRDLEALVLRHARLDQEPPGQAEVDRLIDRVCGPGGMLAGLFSASAGAGGAAVVRPAGPSARTAAPEGPGGGPERAPQRVGRNAPCPCGSGERYKRCCGRAA